MNDIEQVREISLSEIFIDRETQIRVAVSEETVQRYYEAMIDEHVRDLFPPILLFRDPEGRLWLADGHHRVMAAQRRGFKSILAVVQPGTKADAIWEAIKANSRNGLPLQSVDIRRAIGMVLNIWPDRSNRMIAEALGCNEGTVRRHRDTLPTAARAAVETRIGKDGKRRPARRAGKIEKTADEPKVESRLVVPASAAEEKTKGKESPILSDEQRRILAQAKEKEIAAALDVLESQVAEFYKHTPLEEQISFTRELCGQIVQLNATYERQRYESLLKNYQER